MAEKDIVDRIRMEAILRLQPELSGLCLKVRQKIVERSFSRVDSLQWARLCELSTVEEQVKWLK